MSSVLRRLMRDSAIYGAALVLSRSLVLLLLPIYSRELTPTEYGVYSLLLTSAAVISGVMSLGFGTAVLRHAVVDTTRDPRDYYVSALAGHAVVAVAVIGAAFAFGEELSLVLLGDRGQRTWLVLTVATAVLTTLSLSPASYLRYRERARTLSTLRILQYALLGALNVFVLLVLDWGIGGLLLSEVIVGAGMLAASVAVTRGGLRGRVTRGALGELIRFGLPLVPATLAMTALLAADRYFLNALGYERELGLYSMAYRFGVLILLLVSAVQTAWPPIMFAAADEEGAHRRFGELYTGFFTGFAWLGVALALVSPPVIALITPESYWGGTRVVPYVVLAYVLHAVHAIVGNALHKSGRTMRLAFALLVATGVNIGMNALLIPDHGMMGAALATLGAYVVLVIVTGILAHRDFPVRYERSRLARAALACALGYALGRLVAGDLGSLQSWGAAALGSTSSGLLLVLFGVIGRSDLARVRSLLRSRHPRGELRGMG